MVFFDLMAPAQSCVGERTSEGGRHEHRVSSSHHRKSSVHDKDEGGAENRVEAVESFVGPE